MKKNESTEVLDAYIKELQEELHIAVDECSPEYDEEYPSSSDVQDSIQFIKLLYPYYELDATLMFPKMCICSGGAVFEWEIPRICSMSCSSCTTSSGRFYVALTSIDNATWNILDIKSFYIDEPGKLDDFIKFIKDTFK